MSGRINEGNRRSRFPTTSLSLKILNLGAIRKIRKVNRTSFHRTDCRNLLVKVFWSLQKLYVIKFINEPQRRP